VVPEGTPGAVWLRGRVVDGAGVGVPEALVESWQADPHGGFAHTAGSVSWFGRCPTDEEGRWAILTCKPGAVPGPGGRLQAPFVDLSVFARGLLDRLVTRLYFADEDAANAADPALAALDADRHAGLIAHAAEDGYTL